MCTSNHGWRGGLERGLDMHYNGGEHTAVSVRLFNVSLEGEGEAAVVLALRSWRQTCLA